LTTEESRLRRHRKKLVFLMAAGAVSIIFLAIGAYQLMEFTDSTAFCGRLCHKVMYPEYTAYQASPHSRVACVQCHVGYGGNALIRSKISGIPQVWAVTFNTYERPIPTPVANLRPAPETCEQCHRPERFTGDLVVTTTTFDENAANIEHVDTRIMRVGGAESLTGIHWHIATKVYYLALDKQRQDIAWVGVENPDGSLTEYIDPASANQVTPQRIATDKRLMDCIDCHNRATHIYKSPEQIIDEDMAQGLIDKTLPYIKWAGSQALDPPNDSLEEAFQKVDVISDFYRVNFPDVYAAKKPAIDQAVGDLREVAKLTTFPWMHVTWKTYLDNLGHINSPGCFRCHGKLVPADDIQSGTTINATCDLCHYFQLPKQ
jgi:nitrate/TMAO reductase-like tetraheme cytochrome c subunit